VSTRHFRAPGKLVLLGEYAVLDGAPALAAAIDCGVDCLTTPAEQLQIDTGSFEPSFAKAALGYAPAAASYTFRTWNPPQIEGKPGFGGSAATVVAGLFAAHALANQPLTKAQLHQKAWQLHRQVQGSGSGIDVACSVYGGLISYQAGQVTAMESVRFTTIYSGNSAATASRIEAYQRWNAQSRQSFAQESERIVLGFHKDPVGAVAAGCTLLRAMSKQADLPYWTPAMDKITTLASDYGGAAKPSGAGGGDCAIAIFSNRDREEAFRQACQQDGWTILPTLLSPGVQELPLQEA
jgi:phosphomevalonate kinase